MPYENGIRSSLRCTRRSIFFLVTVWYLQIVSVQSSIFFTDRRNVSFKGRGVVWNSTLTQHMVISLSGAKPKALKYRDQVSRSSIIF